MLEPRMNGWVFANMIQLPVTPANFPVLRSGCETNSATKNAVTMGTPSSVGANDGQFEMSRHAGTMVNPPVPGDERVAVGTLEFEWSAPPNSPTMRPVLGSKAAESVWTAPSPTWRPRWVASPTIPCGRGACPGSGKPSGAIPAPVILNGLTTCASAGAPAARRIAIRADSDRITQDLDDFLTMWYLAVRKDEEGPCAPAYGPGGGAGPTQPRAISARGTKVRSQGTRRVATRRAPGIDAASLPRGALA